jgi:hypothetical protein
MLLCVAVFFSGLVNFEVRFLFDVGAFGESLFACPKSNPKGQPKPPAMAGLRGLLPGQRTTIFTTGGLIPYEYCLSLTLQSSQQVV